MPLPTPVWHPPPQAELVSQLQDHELWYPGFDNSNTLDVGEQWVVALCRVSR
jgi:hypothetical protein